MIQLHMKRYLISSNSKNKRDTLPFLNKIKLLSIKNVEDLQKLNELIALQNQVIEVRLQNTLGGKNYQQNVKKL